MRLKRNSLFLGATALLLAGCALTPEARESRFLEKGRKEFQNKNYAVALLHFKSAMQARPRDAEPYYQLGLTYLATGDWNSAASCLRKATELNPKLTGAQLKLAELMATSRDKAVVEDAQRRTQDVLNLLPEDADALNVLAQTELRLGNTQSAEAHLEEALRKSPAQLKSSVALAQSRLARKDVAGAEEALKQAAAQAPKSPDPHVYLGGFYQALSRTAEAEQEYRRALEIDPKYGPAMLALAAMQVRAGQRDQAEQTYRAVSALPDAQYKPIHALYLFQSGKMAEAVAEFERLAQAYPADRNLRTSLVKAYLAMNRVGDAEKVLTSALKKNGLDTDAMLQRSRLYLGSGKYAEAQADLNQVLHYRNSSAEAHFLLSKVHQGRGEAAMRQQELGEALRLDPSLLTVRMELAKVLMAGGGAQAALQFLDQAPQDQKGAAGIIVTRNWALIALGQKAEARKGVDQVLAAGKLPEAQLQDAVLKLDQKDYAGARAAAEAVLTQAPAEVRALSVVVQTYSLQNQLPAGLQRAREQAARQSGSADMQQFLGQLLLTHGDHAGARKAFEAAKADNPASVTAELALGEMDTTEGRRDDARKRLSAVVAAHPESLPGHVLLAQLEMIDGKKGPAIEQFRKAVALDDKNAHSLNGLAYLLAESNQPDEALKYAQKAKALAPDDPAVDDTLGWTYFQKGLYPLAITHLEGATAKGGTAVRKYHLAMAYWKAGDTQHGRQVLDAAIKLDPTLPEAQEARRVFGLNSR